MTNKCHTYNIRHSMIIIALLLLVVGINFNLTEAAATEPYGLAAMQQFERLPYLKLDTMAGQQSSYDRDGGNDDGFGASNYLYMEGSEKVMLDLKGPGCVYCIWFTGYDAATAYLKVFFNGESTPRINRPLREIFAGTNAPFLAPLVGDNTVSSGGFYCYLPMPFSQSIKMVTNGTGGSFFYHVGYHLYSPGTAVTTYTGSEDSSAVRTMWNNAGVDPKSQTGNTTVTNTINLAAGATSTLLDTSGPRSISSIKIRIPGTEPPQTVTDNGRAHKGYSQFLMALNSSNTGVTLKRRLDYGIADQKANIYVDGAYVGQWFDAGSDPTYRWRDNSFSIPSTFTAGKTSILIKVTFVSAAIDWNEFYYWAYSKVSGVDTLTDSLDVGNTSSESSHSYTINTQNWSGSNAFQYPPGSNTADILNNIWLRIYWNSESSPSVYAPLGSFFAMGQFGAYATRALPVGMDSSNNMYVYYPMPFASRAQIQLVSQRSSATNNIWFEIKHKPFSDPFTNVGYFKTNFHTETPTTNGNDILILDVEGSGHFLGVVESVKGPTSRAYLEGDERFYVDDSQTMCYHGTGTEDFYNSGWYFDRGLFTKPMHGYTAHVVDSYDKTTAYRLFLQDTVPFRKHIRVGIEHGPVNDVSADAWTLAYYYYKSNNRAVLTDTLNVGNATSESSHSYVINTQNWTGSRTYTYEGDFDTVNYTDDGRAHKGYSQFRMAIQSNNQGVILRRRFDQMIGQQRADVYVDGLLVGPWYWAGTNTYHNWRDEDFMIPASFTSGKTQITIKVQFVSAALDWNEFTYKAYTLVP